jgi:hypothetical protein
MKTEQEQLDFSNKQKEIAQSHSDLVSSIGTPITDAHIQMIKKSEEVMIAKMQELIYSYIGTDFHKMMKDKQ